MPRRAPSPCVRKLWSSFGFSWMRRMSRAACLGCLGFRAVFPLPAGAGPWLGSCSSSSLCPVGHRHLWHMGGRAVTTPCGSGPASVTLLCHPRCCMWEWEPDCRAHKQVWLQIPCRLLSSEADLFKELPKICQDKLTHSTLLTACCCPGAGAQRGGRPQRKGWHLGKVWGGFCSPGITFVPCKPQWNCHGRLQEPRGAFHCTRNLQH